MLTLNTTGYELYNSAIVKADGCIVADSDNKSYVDMESGVWALPLGHNHCRVLYAMTEQAAKISHVGYRYTAPIVEQASEELLSIAGLKGGKCVFLSSGSEAVEFALKIAERTTERKPLMLKLDKHYLSAYGLSNDEKRWVTLDWQSGEDPQKLTADLPFDKIGAFMFEPGNASGTVKLPPVHLIQDIVSKVKSNGGWVIADEVTAGIGRTGKWFGFENFNIQPDIIACGKGLGNGYPVSAVAVSIKVCNKLQTSGFLYAQSHQNDPLGCAVVKAVIDTIRDEDLIERSALMGRWLKTNLIGLSKKYPCIKDVRGIGLMCAVEFRGMKDEAWLINLHKKLYEAGYIAGLKPSANVLRFYPPLIISKELIDGLINSLDEILAIDPVGKSYSQK